MFRDFYINTSEELNDVVKMMKRVERQLQSAPTGSLWENRMKNRTSYRQFIAENKDKYPNGKYISCEEKELISNLAQKDYNEKLLKWLKQAEKQLKSLCKCYEENNPEIIYNKLSDGRKALVNSVFLPDEVFINRWKARIKTEDNQFENDRNIYTEQGERVRSKSEKIIADKLWLEKVPYVYEPNIILLDGTRYFPDFAVLNTKTREEYFWEHFGMMDDPLYCRRALEKIEKYQINGFGLGRKLICTFETHDRELGKSVIESVIKEYLYN